MGSQELPPQDAGGPSHRLRNLATLTALNAVDTAGAGLLGNVFPGLAQTLRLGTGDLGLLTAAGRLVSLPFGPAWVSLSNRAERRRLLAGLSAIGGLAMMAAGSARSLTSLAVAQLSLTAVLVGVLPMTLGILADNFDDRRRSRAIGVLFGGSTLLSTGFVGLSIIWLRFDEGWRWSYRVAGGCCLLAALVTAVVLREPQVGSAEIGPDGGPIPRRPLSPRLPQSLAALLRTRTVVVVLVSRLLSSHVLITVFGVQFLVIDRGLDSATAASVVLPYGVGYSLGAVGGGWLVALADRLAPDRGRIAVLQAAQAAFATAAYAATQFPHPALLVYAAYCLLLGTTQALNPVANRPLLAAVTVPEVRGQAFAMLGVADTIAVVLLSATAGLLADRFGLTAVFAWFLVVLILVNGLWLTALHLCYPSDRDQIKAALAMRRASG